ncbi:tetratricopeptide (TPR) repeat protein [Duganella sp. 1224]|uniref:tetratricopeptide repeat protein n=1 Tax=Duganella sp. 1224 TaxID=2587052 RepID=UPI0015CE599C|nr:tetratricopeptide repeat protein [Duganella sp. 1224]NYE62854.1 tetratricopeptide (TPR) repeat protein [Duganella sp. 1224]
MKTGYAVSLLLALVCAAGQASVLPNQAAAPLQQEAVVLTAQGKYKDAIAKFQEAAKADPAASGPLAGIANVLMMASLQAQGEAAARLRGQAESVARQALALGADDPLAQEVLRHLLDDKPAPLHVPTPAAAKAMQEGEVLFHAKQYDEALAKYQEAARLDPQYSAAEVYAGDCYFAQKKWPESEERFRKATEIEPLNGQAWRFLADALSWQGKWPAAETALFNGIAAQPNQLPTWDKLASLRGKQGYPLTALHLQRKSFVKLDANGKFVINLDEQYRDDKARLAGDGAMWFAYAAFEVDARLKNQQANVADQPFAIEVAAWRSALKVVDEVVANGGDDIHDPALLNLRMLARDGQLEAGLMLLQYRESWRAEFEAWKKAHPDGVRKFVNTYALRP